MNKDPYTLVYEKLWDLLEKNQDFPPKVVVGNRIKFSSLRTRNPYKIAMSLADYPQVGITPQGGLPHTQSTSSSSFDLSNFRILIATSTYDVNEQLYPIRWEIYRAALLWKQVLISNLTYTVNQTEYAFVHNATLRKWTEVPVASETRNYYGWIGWYDMDVQMHFQTSAIKPADL